MRIFYFLACIILFSFNVKAQVEDEEISQLEFEILAYKKNDKVLDEYAKRNKYEMKLVFNGDKSTFTITNKKQNIYSEGKVINLKTKYHPENEQNVAHVEFQFIWQFQNSNHTEGDYVYVILATKTDQNGKHSFYCEYELNNNTLISLSGNVK